MTAIALIHRDTIIERLANGEFLKDISADLNVKPPSISRPLADDPEYQAARKSGAELRLETHFQKLASSEDDAKDKAGNVDLQAAANLARVREATWRAAAWFAEREFPERWGARPQSPGVSESMADLLMTVSAKMLRDQEKVVPSQHAPLSASLDITPVAQSSPHQSNES